MPVGCEIAWSGHAPDTVPASDRQLAVAVEAPSADGRVVRPQGEVDLATASLLRDALLAAVQPPVRIVAVDLDGIGFLGAHGLDALLDGYRAADECKAVLVLTGGQRPVRRVLSLTGLTSVFRTAGSVEQALAS